MVEIEKKGTWKEWNIKQLLGEGSFGKVYQIEREEFGHVYEAALKVITIPKSQNEIKSILIDGMDQKSVTTYFESIVEDIVKEFVLMSELKGNSNIVSYEDHAVVPLETGIGWTIYIRMELLTPLVDYLSQHELSRRDIIQLGIDMCSALEVCQKYNIIHRDIKPENIFVSKLGRFKLGDFGIARQMEKTTSGLSKKGTYTYMAPEVYKGERYNSTVDIYSLGIVLYRFLNNNRTPFLPDYPNAIRYADKEKANIMRMSGATMSKPCNAEGKLSEIILKACAFNPKERYESAGDMKRALEAVLYEENEAKFIYPEGDQLNNEPLEYVMSSTDKKEEFYTDISDDSMEDQISELIEQTEGTIKEKYEAEGQIQEEGTIYLFDSKDEKMGVEGQESEIPKLEEQDKIEADSEEIKKEDIEDYRKENSVMKKEKQLIHQNKSLSQKKVLITLAGVILMAVFIFNMLKNNNVDNDINDNVVDLSEEIDENGERTVIEKMDRVIDEMEKKRKKGNYAIETINVGELEEKLEYDCDYLTKKDEIHYYFEKDVLRMIKVETESFEIYYYGIANGGTNIIKDSKNNDLCLYIQNGDEKLAFICDVYYDKENDEKEILYNMSQGDFTSYWEWYKDSKNKVTTYLLPEMIEKVNKILNIEGTLVDGLYNMVGYDLQY